METASGTPPARRPNGIAGLAYPIAARALRNILSHGDASPHPRGAHESCAVRQTRSGCGIRIVNRPSAVVRPVIPSG